MDVRALRYFVEVVNQQGFTRAAEALHVTQPTISKMVRSLEDELGGPLLIREGRHTRLTDAGKVVHARGQAVLNEVARLYQEVAEVEGLTRGELMIGIPPATGPYFAQAIGAYRQQYPDVTLRLREQGTRALEDAVASGELDIGVTFLPVARPGIASYPVARQAASALFPIARAPAGQGPVAFRELADYPFVLYEDDFALACIVSDACASAGFVPNVVARSRYWDFIGELVAADVGIGILPDEAFTRLDPARIARRPLKDPEVVWELGLIWREDYVSRAARAWLGCCERIFPRPLQSNGVAGEVRS
ncbi:LysR substrate-binding domain-containing protein [Thauera sinica]|uniref:LysR substrate-binding domain-containing protein n=1 Tax=Thauera sinica TaxID=2665146 RepID=A0ABW1AV66_9RHOO|nr:LysR substrate-binding domain-containing protein [Thauera sp. K11]ATE61150.1 LysR family transcriptional regulator [Thauera sp. K11]